jgi:hypothetical protein
MYSDVYAVKTGWRDMSKIMGSTKVIFAHASKAHKPFNLLFSNLKEASETGEKDEETGSPLFLVQLKRAGTRARASHA